MIFICLFVYLSPSHWYLSSVSKRSLSVGWFGAELWTLQCAHLTSGNLAEMRVLTEQDQGGARECAFITSTGGADVAHPHLCSQVPVLWFSAL